MCSNNQSGIPSSVRDSSEHLPQKFYKALCDAAHPYTDNLASEMDCSLANIIAQCELMQDIASEVNPREPIQVRASSLVGFTEMLMRQAAAVQVMHEELLSQRFQLEKSLKQSQQALSDTKRLVSEYRSKAYPQHQVENKKSEVKA